MDLKPRCYKCKTEDGIMASIFACGEYYMCDLCIRKEKINKIYERIQK